MRKVALSLVYFAALGPLALVRAVGAVPGTLLHRSASAGWHRRRRFEPTLAALERQS